MSMASAGSRAIAFPRHLSVDVGPDLPKPSAGFLPCLHVRPAYSVRRGRIAFSTPTTGNSLHVVVRSVDLFPIDYAFRPRLRGRLTLGGVTFPRKPIGFRRTGFSPVLARYSCPDNHFHFVHHSFRYGFNLVWNAPLPLPRPAGPGNPRLRYRV